MGGRVHAELRRNGHTQGGGLSYAKPGLGPGTEDVAPRRSIPAKRLVDSPSPRPPFCPTLPRLATRPHPMRALESRTPEMPKEEAAETNIAGNDSEHMPLRRLRHLPPNREPHLNNAVLSGAAVSVGSKRERETYTLFCCFLVVQGNGKAEAPRHTSRPLALPCVRKGVGKGAVCLPTAGPALRLQPPHHLCAPKAGPMAAPEKATLRAPSDGGAATA